MRIAFGYVRVSSIEQEHGFGPEVQINKIKEYARSKGLPEPEFFQESKSGESITKRYELHTILARAEAVAEEKGEAHVIFYSLDRLSRDVIDQESVVLRAFRTGVRLHSTQGSENDTLDPAFSGDPMRAAMRQMMGVFHQLERAIIQRRLDSGLTIKAQRGGFTGGRPPFGYLSHNQDLIVDVEKIPIVRRVFDLAAAQVDHKTIAAMVGREFPACAHWQHQQVGRLLAREALYRDGAYRPRGGVADVVRADLVIFPREKAK